MENFNNKKYEIKVGRLAFYIGFNEKQFKRIKLFGRNGWKCGKMLRKWVEKWLRMSWKWFKKGCLRGLRN